MKRRAFVLGALLVTLGVALHFPVYISAADMHYMIADMPMGQPMVVGMALISAGMACAIWGLTPDQATRQARTRRAVSARFRALDQAGLSRQHRSCHWARKVKVCR